ncbi:hypothetical protein CBR_g6668 [Chara braunii]|uniref:Uncharacterized protein n=1 Tax=Chara braunii TaxID=69332 RepID=A0A388KKF5_CHABU|nr:hypothetical protein CBR_g6668 [Chara braunii]|eukprot:GBG70540.1 hypothetical protein CBR_g6668 [Chara braunii]
MLPELAAGNQSTSLVYDNLCKLSRASAKFQKPARKPESADEVVAQNEDKDEEAAGKQEGEDNQEEGKDIVEQLCKQGLKGRWEEEGNRKTEGELEAVDQGLRGTVQTEGKSGGWQRSNTASATQGLGGCLNLFQGSNFVKRERFMGGDGCRAAQEKADEPSPRSAEIERVQAQLWREQAAREERRRELEFLEQKGANVAMPIQLWSACLCC